MIFLSCDFIISTAVLSFYLPTYFLLNFPHSKQWYTKYTQIIVNKCLLSDNDNVIKVTLSDE